jgi:hypothetical protein
MLSPSSSRKCSSRSAVSASPGTPSVGSQPGASAWPRNAPVSARLASMLSIGRPANLTGPAFTFSTIVGSSPKVFFSPSRVGVATDDILNAVLGPTGDARVHHSDQKPAASPGGSSVALRGARGSSTGVHRVVTSTSAHHGPDAPRVTIGQASVARGSHLPPRRPSATCRLTARERKRPPSEAVLGLPVPPVRQASPASPRASRE